MHVRVRLKTFNGTAAPPANCRASENYWLLIGEAGEVIAPANEGLRVLVRFDRPVAALGLACHNAVPDSLLILASDLEPLG